MNIKKILEVTAEVTGLANPMLGKAIAYANDFFLADEQIPLSATGEEVDKRIKKTDPMTQAAIYSKDIDLEIKQVESWTQIQKVHAESDQSGASTRPMIAMIMACVIALSVTPISLAIAWAIIDSSEPLKAAADNYLMVIALIGTPATLLTAYFGMRTREKKARYAASVGQSIHPAGILSSIFGGRK